jgi:hypothetical protein
MRQADLTPAGTRPVSSATYQVAGSGGTEEQKTVIEVTFSTPC